MTVAPSGPSVVAALAWTWSAVDGTCGSAAFDEVEASTAGFGGAAAARSAWLGGCSTRATTALGQVVG